MEKVNKNIARVVSEHKGAYKVRNEVGEFLAKVTGKQMFTALSREDFPAVGDWVVINDLGNGNALIKEVLPRATILKRIYKERSRIGGKIETQIIATNIDVAFVVESVGKDFNLNRFERYFSIISDSNIKPVIIINKIDLISKEELAEILLQIKKRFPDIFVICISAFKTEGLNELQNYIESGKTYCFLGSSGVGKSSIINKLLGKDLLKTGEISLHSNRGKHTTSGRQMYFLSGGGIVIDNPGIREVGTADAKEGVEDSFSEITELHGHCKYNDCSHTHEVGCAVLQAVKLGQIDSDKYSNYVKLKKEAEFYEMAKDEKKDKERKFGKLIKTAKKSLNKYN